MLERVDRTQAACDVGGREEGCQDEVNIAGVRGRDARVDRIVGDGLVDDVGVFEGRRATHRQRPGAGVARLQHVQGTAHVALRQVHQRVDRVCGNIDALRGNNEVDDAPDVVGFERGEAEARAAGEQRGGQFVRVVGDDAEARVGGVLFHDAAERHLRRGRHGVGFVEDDELEAAEAVRGWGCAVGGVGLGLGWLLLGGGGEDLFGAGEGLDLFADDVDAAVVGGVEFEDHLAHVLWSVDLAG